MKKILLTISLTILMISTVKSQEKTKIAVLGNLNLTSMTANDFLNKVEYKTGFQIGALIEFPIGEKFSLQPEILYSMQRVKGIVPLLYVVYPNPIIPAEPTYGEFKLNYLKIPFLAKIYLTKIFSLEIGPSFNFLISDKLKYNSNVQGDIAKKFEFAGIIGLSYKIKPRIIAIANYFNGFSNIFKRDFKKTKNYGFAIGLGYFLK
ncbi:MAG: porin family protein [Lutibacter sp.]